jgi:hypothetical protein
MPAAESSPIDSTPGLLTPMREPKPATVVTAETSIGSITARVERTTSPLSRVSKTRWTP